MLMKMDAFGSLTKTREREQLRKHLLHRRSSALVFETAETQMNPSSSSLTSRTMSRSGQLNHGKSTVQMFRTV